MAKWRLTRFGRLVHKPWSRALGLVLALGVAAVLVSVRTLADTEPLVTGPLAVAGAVVLVGGLLALIARSFGPKVLRVVVALSLLLALSDLASTGAASSTPASAPQTVTETDKTTITDVEDNETTTVDPVTGEQVTTTTSASTTMTESSVTETVPTVASSGSTVTNTDTDESLFAYVDAGLEKRAQDLLPDSFGRPKIGLVGWLLLAALIALGWRHFEHVNARRSATPVVVEKFIVPGKYEHAEKLTSQFENGLAHAGILEPASVPGGAVTDELIEIFGKDKGPTNWFTPVLSLLRLAMPKRGTVVIPTLESETPPKISVRVVTAREQRTLYARSFEAKSMEASIQRAAAYVGQVALSHGKLTPRWARWESENAEGFDLFVDVHSGRGFPEELDAMPELDKEIGLQPVGAVGEPKLRRMRALQMALRNSPTNGIVRVELGNEFELLARPGDRWKALRLYLEAAHDHPRLVVAKYRVATTLSILAGDIQNGEIDPAQATDLAAVRSLLPLVLDGRAVKKLFKSKDVKSTFHDSFAAMGQPDQADEVRKEAAQELAETAAIEAVDIALLTLADEALDQATALLAPPRLCANALIYRAERNYWLDLLRNRDRRRHLGEQIQVVRYIVELRGKIPEFTNVMKVSEPKRNKTAQTAARDKIDRIGKKTDKLVDRRRQRGEVGAGTFYNAACFFAVMAQVLWRDEARSASLKRATCGYLQRSRRAVGGGFPSSRWLEKDPDLAAVRDHPVFNELCQFASSREKGMDRLWELANAPGNDDSEPLNPSDPVDAEVEVLHVDELVHK